MTPLAGLPEDTSGGLYDIGGCHVGREGGRYRIFSDGSWKCDRWDVTSAGFEIAQTAGEAASS